LGRKIKTRGKKGKLCIEIEEVEKEKFT